ncbi:MAG: tRNA (adenosine(37)-N6)-dimethylallyltransferase MiaA [Eubacteriales bacterium]|jgi:tRNA dimethylallyltransferase
MADIGKSHVYGENNKKKPVIVLTGPTAVGKTKLSLSLAGAVRGSIISADSVQVYRGLDIGSDKLPVSERMGIPHYLIDVLDPDQDFNVYLFQKMAREAMEEIWASGRIPVIVGGTGFYIQAVLRDIDFTEEDGKSDIRTMLEEKAEEEGPEKLYEMLKSVDPAAAESIHPNNVRRVIRALEFHEQTGELISEHNEEQREKKSPYNFLYFVLDDDRKILYSRIEERVDSMISKGLVDEVKGLIDQGLNEDSPSMKALGYRELFPYLHGECTLDEAVQQIKTDTRHFAKRQLTWFRREDDVIWIEKEDFDRDEQQILDYILMLCRAKHIL